MSSSLAPCAWISPAGSSPGPAASCTCPERNGNLLALFARHPDHVLTHKHILREVWGPAHTGDTAYLRVYVKQLRQKLEDDPAQPRLLVTDPGVGYRLKRKE